MGEWCVTEFPFYLSQDVSEKNIRIIKHHVPIKRRNDAESVDNESTLSTTSNLEPFANDDLGKKKKNTIKNAHSALNIHHIRSKDNFSLW